MNFLNNIRACLAGMRSFSWATVSAVKIAFSPFRNGKGGTICRGGGTVVSERALMYCMMPFSIGSVGAYQILRLGTSFLTPKVEPHSLHKSKLT